MAKKSLPSAVAFPDEDQDTLVFEDADEFMSRQSAQPIEDVQAKVHEAQAELMQLRQRQEEIERQKMQLELIKKKQDAFAQGKRDLMEKLNRSVQVIERELYNTQKLTEELNTTHKTFAGHLEVLRGLQPEKWQRTNVDAELNNALEAIEDAKDEYLKSSRRMSSLRPETAGRRAEMEDGENAARRPAEMSKEDFKALVKRGFALSLPLIAAGVVGLIFARILF